MSDHYHHNKLKFDRCECEYHGGKSEAGYVPNAAPPSSGYSSATYDAGGKQTQKEKWEEHKKEEFDTSKQDYKKNEKGESNSKPLSVFDTIVDEAEKEVLRKKDKETIENSTKTKEQEEFDWIKQVIEATKKKSN